MMISFTIKIICTCNLITCNACFLETVSFFHVIFFFVNASEKLWSEFGLSEIFWLSLAVVKVSSWKFNSNADASSSTDSVGSSSVCSSCLEYHHFLIQIQWIPLHWNHSTFRYKYQKGLQRFYLPHFVVLCWEPSYNWHEFALFLKQYSLL